MNLQNWRVSCKDHCTCGNTRQNYVQSDKALVEAIKNLKKGELKILPEFVKTGCR